MVLKLSSKTRRGRYWPCEMRRPRLCAELTALVLSSEKVALAWKHVWHSPSGNPSRSAHRNFEFTLVGVVTRQPPLIALARAADAVEDVKISTTHTGSPRLRRPRGYWTDIANIRQEIAAFWQAHGVTCDAVPSETLLQIGGAHGLRHGIATHGGKDEVGAILGVAVIPSRWKDALQEPVVQRLVRNAALLAAQPADGLRPKPKARRGAGPPLPVQGPSGGATPLVLAVKARWPSQQRLETARLTRRRLRGGVVGSGRRGRPPSDAASVAGVAAKASRSAAATAANASAAAAAAAAATMEVPRADPGVFGPALATTTAAMAAWKSKGYWRDEANFAAELFPFLLTHQRRRGLPACWMPRLVDFECAGRSDLSLAISRSGSAQAVARRFRLIYHGEWSYFLDLLKTLRALQGYMRERGGSPGRMPALVELKRAGESRLRDAISRHGGRKALAGRFGLRLAEEKALPMSPMVRSHLQIPMPPPPRSQQQRRMSPWERDLRAAEPTAVAAAAAAAAASSTVCASAPFVSSRMLYGDFDLDVAVDLFEYVMSRHYRRKLVAPTAAAVAAAPAAAVAGPEQMGGHMDRDGWESLVTMPLRAELIRDGLSDMVLKIDQYGGFESVARRCGLAYDDRVLAELKKVTMSAARRSTSNIGGLG